MIGHVPWISEESGITKVIMKNCLKIGKMTPLAMKNGIFKSLKFLIVQGSRDPNITFQGEKL